MVAELQRQQQEEVQQRDFCIKSLNENELNIQNTQQNKENLENLKQKLESEITEAKERIVQLNDDIKQNLAAMKLAGENHLEESKRFQEDTQDQRNIQLILQKVLCQGAYVFKFLISKSGFYGIIVPLCFMCKNKPNLCTVHVFCDPFFMDDVHRRVMSIGFLLRER